VWTSEGNCGGKGRESKIEREIHATFTFVRAAFESARVVYNGRHCEDGELSEKGLPITELAHLKEVENDVGILKGWRVKPDGTVVQPSTDEILDL
jgi:hypothetical protein